MRRLIAFDSEGETLIGSLDEGTMPSQRHPYPGEGRGPVAGPAILGPGLRRGTEKDPEGRGPGLLIVSGGNEIRCGAHRGMALLAADLAERGIPVFRFDRRGIGDSTGENRGFRSSAPDIAAAAAAFRAETNITRLVAFGNCDAASALALFGRAAGIDAVILANPWVVETADDLPPPAAIRARYADRLRNWATWGRLLRGDISLTKVFRGVRRIAPSSQPANALADRALAAIDDWGAAATIILANGDATAIAYADAAKNAGLRTRTIGIDTASHSFAGTEGTPALKHEIEGIILSVHEQFGKAGYVGNSGIGE